MLNNMENKKRKNILILLAVGLLMAGIVGGAVYFLLSKPKINMQYDMVKKGNVKEMIKASGQVKASESVDLSLAISGKVKSVSAQVGDKIKAGQVILELENADLVAQLAQAQAVLNKQLAGNTPEYIAQLQAALDKANNDLMQVQGEGDGAENSKLVRNAYDDAYANLQSVQVVLSTSLTAADNILGVDNTLSNDSFKDNLSTQDTDKLMIAKSKYVSAKEAKNDFDQKFNVLSGSSDHKAIDAEIISSKTALLLMRDLLSATTNMLNATPAIGKITNDSLNGMKASIENARANTTAKYAAILAQEHSLSTARDNYISLKSVADRAQAALNDAKNPPRDVDTASSRALVSLAAANYDKTIMRSPIDGVITKQDAKVGGMISPSVPLVSVINTDQYQIDVLLSEADMARVKVGDKAEITLDSFGDNEIFSATVVKIDPAGQSVNGVVNYKITLQFDKQDERLKAGLTANVKISAAGKEEVLLLPSRDFIQKSGQYYVLIKEGENMNREIKVNVGLKGFDGNWEIISGLNENDQVISYGL